MSLSIVVVHRGDDESHWCTTESRHDVATLMSNISSNLDYNIVCGRSVVHGRRIVVQFYEGGSLFVDAACPKPIAIV